MTALLGLAAGLLIAGVVRIYAGERFASRVPLVNAALAIASFAVWVVGGSDVAVALPIAVGILMATLILRVRSIATKSSRQAPTRPSRHP